MSNYYTIEPEVAGGWGPDTVFTRSPGQRVVVCKLHYCFDGWLGDDLLESTPCFIVTERLAAEIGRSKLSGVRFDQVAISKSGQFEDRYPDRQLPKFLWLKPEGEPGRDDFGLTTGLQLIVSQSALAVLNAFEISHALVAPVEANG